MQGQSLFNMLTNKYKIFGLKLNSSVFFGKLAIRRPYLIDSIHITPIIKAQIKNHKRLLPGTRIICILFFVLSLFSCATMTNPIDIKNAEAHNKLGISNLNEGHLNEAFVEFQKAIKLDPENKESLNYLGYVSARFYKYDDAIAYYMRAISVDPEYSEAMNNLGVVYLDIENWDKAIEYFKAALNNKVYSTPEKAFTSMGYAYYKKGELTYAEEALKEALIRNQAFPLAMYTLGMVYLDRGDDKAAIRKFEQAVEILPNYIDAHWELGNAYVRAGNSQLAIEHFKIVSALEKNTSRAKEASDYAERLK